MTRSVSVKITVDAREVTTVYDLDDKTFQQFHKIGKGYTQKQYSGFTNYESLSPELKKVFSILIGESSFD